MLKGRKLTTTLATALCAALAGGIAMKRTKAASGDELRNSRFFQVDTKALKVVGPAPYVGTSLRLDLVSVSVDQPQYWPKEKVNLKILMPGRPGATIVASWNRRDATAKEEKAKLDDQGVAVVLLADGEKKPLEVGEYRVDVRSEDGKTKGSATFAVIEGTLGALSLAHEFKQVTNTDELDKLPGGWFLGNAAGAGKRWGNGLSFKNELRADNRSYAGSIQYISRCMLPGCNGVQAGPTRDAEVKEGKIWGTLDVGGHSGPFQLELITKKGSLRHQFEGSSHVERDMVQVARGVSYVHKAGLAPYEGTVQVPGRQIFVERDKHRVNDEPFEVAAVIAQNGKLTIKVLEALDSPALHLYVPKNDGSYEVKPQKTGKSWKAGEILGAGVDFNTRDDALFFHVLRKRNTA